MKLSKQEADLFFKLMWSLQFFVNEKLQVLATVKSFADYKKCSMEDKFQVREALFDNPQLIDSFVQENPQNFSPDELDVVAKWKLFRKGDFYIERFLKQHAIFISDEDEVFGVVGLQDAFDEMIPREALPVRVNTILLPFQGKIIYDGLLRAYNIFFGGGITGELKEIYLAAKQNGKIITSFESEPKKPKILKPLKDWQPELEELAARAAKLRGGSGQPAIYSPAFSIVKYSLELARLAVSNGDTDALIKCMEKIDRELGKASDALYRSRRY